jgi:hypothetical protein
MMIVMVISRGPTDVCTLLRAKCATYLGLDGSHLVLQEVSDADDYCHGQRNMDQDRLLMLLCVLACEILDESLDTRLISS